MQAADTSDITVQAASISLTLAFSSLHSLRLGCGVDTAIFLGHVVKQQPPQAPRKPVLLLESAPAAPLARRFDEPAPRPVFRARDRLEPSLRTPLVLNTCPDCTYPAIRTRTGTLLVLILRILPPLGTSSAAAAGMDALGPAAKLRFCGLDAHLSNTLGAPAVPRPFQVMLCDLSDLESVRSFARAFEEKHGGQLDVLVNNGEPRVSSRFSMVSRVGNRLIMSEMFPAWYDHLLTPRNCQARFGLVPGSNPRFCAVDLAARVHIKATIHRTTPKQALLLPPCRRPFTFYRQHT